MTLRKTLLISSISALSIMANPTHAMNFTTTFTGDNFVNSFSFNDDGTPFYQLIDTTGLSGSQAWTDSSTLSLTLNDYSQYEFIWQTTNASGPAAFLADITLGNMSYSTSTDPNIWSYSADGINWASVTSYGQNGVSPWGTISAINPNAEWIWDDAYQTNESLYLKASITSPVPEPSTYGLMLGGLGLVGFMANRRRQNKQRASI